MEDVGIKNFTNKKIQNQTNMATTNTSTSTANNNELPSSSSTAAVLVPLQQQQQQQQQYSLFHSLRKLQLELKKEQALTQQARQLVQDTIQRINGMKMQIPLQLQQLRVELEQQNITLTATAAAHAAAAASSSKSFKIGANSSASSRQAANNAQQTASPKPSYERICKFSDPDHPLGLMKHVRLYWKVFFTKIFKFYSIFDFNFIIYFVYLYFICII